MDGKQQPLAIVGYSYRAPGVGRSNLWELLEQAKSAWSPVPPERFDAKAYYHPSSERAGCITSDGGHFLPGDVYAFDAPFFNFRSDEAKYVDPKVRLLLECTWEAMESAGVRPPDLARSRIGVFAATGASDYVTQLMDDMPTSSSFTALGTAPCMTSNRISHFFDLVGPSVSLEAACATGGYALHMACQSVRSGECSAALAAGCVLNLGPENFSTLDTVGTLSVDGKSYSWDARANGFGRGEGATCLLIKPLADAIKVGDPIRAVIRNTTASHCGRTPGISMPSQLAHESLLRNLHEQVGLDPRDTTYVEGHGTGTPVGDPVDASAIAAVFGRDRSPSLPIYLGSIKANVGHLEEASGLLSVVKGIMMIERQRLLPTASFENLNPAIKGGDKLCVLKESLAWPAGTLKRVAVGNYGFGGANAAILLEEAPSDSTRTGDLAQGVNISANDLSSEQGQKLFVFSAKSAHSLEAYLQRFQQYANDLPRESTKDLCFTLGQRRAHLPYRAAFTANSTSSLSESIASSLASGAKSSKSGDVDITFVFTGQGAQYFRMAVGLSHYPIFAAAMDEADKFLQSLGSSWSLQEELAKTESNSRIDEPAISQPTCTAVQLALVQLLREFGIAPSKVVGHSSGEIAGAFAAGLISFRSALAIAYFRGQAATEVLQDTTISGSMLAVGTGPEGARELFPRDGEGYATIAAYNSANSVTISGDHQAIDAIRTKAEDRGIFARKLRTGIAYHSKHMEQVAEKYASMIEPHCPADSPIASPDEDIIFVSSVTGMREHKKIVAASSYWVRNMLQPVRFAEALEELLSIQRDDSEQNLRSTTLVEIGPHSALQSPIKETLKTLARPQVSYAPSLVRKADDGESILALTARLWKSGLEVDFGAVNQIHASAARVLVDLPPYEWNKSTSFRHQSQFTQQKLHPQYPYNTLLGWKSSYDVLPDQSFRQVFTIDDMPWLRDHVVGGDVIFPMAGYLCMAVEAIRLTSRSPPTSLLLRDIHVKTALTIQEEEQVQLTTRIRPSGSDNPEERSFELISLSASNEWIVHCHGIIKPEYSSVESALAAQMGTVIANIDQAQLQECDVEEEYAAMKRSGITWGPAFQCMTSLRAKKGTTVHTVGLRPTDYQRFFTDKSPVTVDAPILDSFNHSVGLVQGREGAKSNVTVPTFISRARISNNITSNNFTIGTVMPSHDSKSGNCTLNVCAFANGEDGSLQQPVLEVEGLQLRCIAKAENNAAIDTVPRSYLWSKTPSIELADHVELARLMPSVIGDKTEMEEDIRVRNVGIYYSDQALQAVKDKDMSHLPLQLSKWITWARHMVAKWPMDMEQVKATIPEVFESSSQGRINCLVGEELVRILHGEVEPLEIILKDGLLNRYYEGHQPTVRGAEGIARYVRLLAGIKPDMRVLEVGGGTGSATLAAMKAMESQAVTDAPWHYTFTDISAGFFPAAKEKLRNTRNVEYQKLDISQDPLQQGFAGGSYDLIIAGLVLHATPNIEETLRNVRTLLKPGGKLLMLEFLDGDLSLLPFTLLPGWWNAEDRYRTELGPELTTDSWQEALRAAGFSGIDHSFSVSDHLVTETPVMSVMCSSRVDTDNSSDPNSPKLTIVGHSADSNALDFANSVADEVKTHCSVMPEIMTLHKFAASAEQYCIVLDPVEHSLLKDLSEASFEALKTTLLNTSGLLWVVPEGADPDAYLISGMLRAMRLEDTSKNFLLLTEVPHDATGARTVSRVAKQLLSETIAPDDEQDFIWSDDLIMLPRLKENLVARQKFELEAGSLVRRERPLWRDDSSTGLELNIENVGDPGTIYFREVKISEQNLREDEVSVRVDAASLNARDLQVLNGRLPWTTPGLEGVGTVVHTGSRVAELQEGDRVMFLAEGGAMATHTRLLSQNICKIPSEMVRSGIAGFPLAYTTAYIALLHTARLTHEDTVLVHGAADTVGQMCIVAAQRMGATVFASAGTADERSALCTNYGLPSSNVFSCDVSDVREGILKATRGQGVHVLINNMSDDKLLQESADSIANFGRWLNLRSADQHNRSGSRANHEFMTRNVTLSEIDTYQFIKLRPQLIGESLREGAKVLQSPVGEKFMQSQTVLPISQLATGIQMLQSDPDRKILLTMGQNESVIGEAQSLAQGTSPLLRSDATYLISGGTGGIGRSLAVWMFEHGAKHVVLLGRSGASRPEVAELLATYSGLRAINCDVCDRDDLTRALHDIKDLPPVRGVIHGAFYIRDSLLVNHTYEDWTRITSPKVQGTYNLDALLPDLDFFISLASMNSIIGLVGVSIYAGTSSFLEAFTRHRLRRGEAAMTIHLPVVEETGYVADRNMVEEMRGTHGISLRISHIQTLVQGAIVGSSSGLCPDGLAISGVLWPLNRGARWEHWPHVRALTSALLAGPEAANEHDESRGGSKGAEGGASAGLLDALIAKVAEMTMMEIEEIPAEMPLSQLGLDSLVAVELRNWIKREGKVELPLTKIVGAKNLKALAEYIASC